GGRSRAAGGSRFLWSLRDLWNDKVGLRWRQFYGTFNQEGRVCGWLPDVAGGGHEFAQREKGFAHLVAAIDRGSGDGGAHHCGAQREEIYSGVRDGEHGGAQAGRVQLHAQLQGPLDEGGYGSGGEAGGHSGRSGSDYSVGTGSGAEGVKRQLLATSC